VRDLAPDRWLGSTSRMMGPSRSSASGLDVDSSRRSRPISSVPPTPDADDQRDERAIVDAVLAGDRDAYRLLVERESASLVRTCYRVLGDLHEAEDAAQEAFVTAYRSLASWRGDGPFGAWLTRIAVRIAIRVVGQRRSVTWLDLSAAAGPAADGTPSGAIDARSIADNRQTDPALMAVRAERAADLRTAVAALPEPYREVVTLRFFAELTLEEIARQTERPLATVKTQLRRGLLQLRGSVESRSDT
jgi:RNA polymerase sigma-70 factor (ECF subfamily)